MNNIQVVGEFTGIIIYNYDFKNKNGTTIKTAKILFNINGLSVFVNSTKLFGRDVGTEVIEDLGFDGSKWIVL